MIPAQTFANFPAFATDGVQTAPEAAKYASGYQASDVLPAEHLNYFEGKSSACITALNKGVASIEAELVNLVQQNGQTASESDNTQVAAAVQGLIQTITGILTNLTTTNKTTLVDAINSVNSALTTNYVKKSAFVLDGDTLTITLE